MRKKKYLEERLAAVSDRLFIINTEDRNFNTAITEKEYIDFSKWFKNDNPIFLEIGCDVSYNGFEDISFHRGGRFEKNTCAFCFLHNDILAGRLRRHGRWTDPVPALLGHIFDFTLCFRQRYDSLHRH